MAASREQVMLRRLLLVEDQRHNIDELRDAFAEEGYECEVALDFATARYILHERMMDLAVVNSKLADVPDDSLIRELKSGNPAMVVVIYNGTATRARQRRLRRLGADSYLSKASDAGTIIRAVQKLTIRKA